MASFQSPTHGRGIASAMLSQSNKKDSYEELDSTYVSPDSSMKINAKGVRGKDGAYLDTVAPQELVVLEELGRGASAVVKRAGRKGTSDQYVVKCFNMYDSNKRRMLREEMKLLMAMNSPSVVKFHGAFLDKSQRICVVLEFMNKGDLEGVVAHSRQNKVSIPEKILCAMIYQIVVGLHYLNSEGFMHRDIKPPNLLVNSQGQVKITDFGIGRKLSDAHSGLSGTLMQDVDEEEEEGDGMANTFVGTRVYMSIERLKGERYSASADVWSLGLVLCEAILGHHPLQSANESFASLIGTLQDTLPRAGEEVNTMGACLDQVAGLSDEARAFADWCLAIDPEIRAKPEDCADDAWFDLHLGERNAEAKCAVAASAVSAWLQQGSMMSYLPATDPKVIPADYQDAAAAIEEPMRLDEPVRPVAEEAGDGELQTIDSDED